MDSRTEYAELFSRDCLALCNKETDSGGISVGLQHAISALQQTSRGPVRLLEKKKSKKKEFDQSKSGSVVTSSAEDNSTDDDIEIISSKAAIKSSSQRRSAPKLDTRTKMFQERLKDLIEAEQSESNTNELVAQDIPPGPSPSPEVPKITEPESIPPTSIPVKLFVTDGSEKSTQLLHKVHSCILERQAATDECIAVSNTNCRTARFDKHKESGRLGEAKVRPVDSTVKEEFYQKYLEEKSNVKDASAQGLSGQINQVSNCVSSLRYLRCSTSFTCHPSSGIINSLMVDYILEQSSHMVRVAAYNYLDSFLYLHLGRDTEDRNVWLTLILSACRTGNDLQWDTFSLENKQDISQCFKFFLKVLNQYQLESKKESTEPSGSELLVQLLSKICRKDFELWWKHFRRSDGKDGRALSYPLIYYLLDGNSNLVPNINKTVVKLYKNTLLCVKDMTVVRHLVSMSGMLLCHLDTQVRQSFIFSGSKVEYAALLETALVESYKDRQDKRHVLTELSLVQPPWLGMLVARRMVMTQEKKTKVNTLCELTSKLSELSLSTNPLVTVAGDCLAHRIMSSCQLHTLFRTHWLHSCDMQGLGNPWKMMDKMDKVGVRSQTPSKVFRFRSGVTFRTGSVVDDLNLLTEYVNGEKFLKDNTGIYSAIIFRMTSPTSF